METLTFEESVKKRPFMYIGSIVNLLAGLITDCITLSKTDEIIFEITIASDNKFIFGVTSKQNLNEFRQKFSTEIVEFKNFYPNVLKIIASEFEIKTLSKTKSEIHFSFDKEIIRNTSLDYWNLTEQAFLLALVNRRCEIVTVDKRQKYVSQNYYHFPQGVFYLFDKAVAEALGRPGFKIAADTKINDRFYQIAVAYRTDWFPRSYVTSFANDVHTTHGGSLVDGILQGLISACKKYVKENNLTTHKINRKYFINGLIIVCAVRGNEFTYTGNTRQKLEDSKVNKDAKELVETLVLDFFKNHKEETNRFIGRFDTSNPLSKILG